MHFSIMNLCITHLKAGRFCGLSNTFKAKYGRQVAAIAPLLMAVVFANVSLAQGGDGPDPILEGDETLSEGDSIDDSGEPEFVLSLFPRTYDFDAVDTAPQMGDYVPESGARDPGNDPPDEEPATAGDPVVVSTGELIHDEVDFNFRGPFPLFFRRYYTSQSDQASTLGSNWSHSYDLRLLVGADDFAKQSFEPCAASPVRCRVLLDKGQVQIFYRPPGSSFFVARGNRGRILYDNVVAGQHMLVEKDGTSFRFNSRGYVTQINDRFGNRILLTYEDTPLYRFHERLCSTGQQPGTAFYRTCRTVAAALRIAQPTVWFKRVEFIPGYDPDALDLGLGSQMVLADELAELVRLQRSSYRLSVYVGERCNAAGTCTPSKFYRTPNGSRANIYIPRTNLEGGNWQRVVSASDDLGRSLQFAYYGEEVSYGGLLKEVSSTLGDAVRFFYTSPDGADEGTEPFDPTVLWTADTREYFLTRTERVPPGSTGEANLQPVAPRTVTYTYDWFTGDGDSVPIVANYDEFLNELHRCLPLRPTMSLATMERIRSATVDNMTGLYIDDGEGPMLIVRSSFERSFERGAPFDRVIGQYFGGPRRYFQSEAESWVRPGADVGSPTLAPFTPFMFSYENNETLGPLPEEVALCNLDMRDPRAFQPPLQAAPLELPAFVQARVDDAMGGIDAVAASCRTLIEDAESGLPNERSVLEPAHTLDVLPARYAASANTVCTWTQTVDRDGKTRLYGFNLQGRLLLDVFYDADAPEAYSGEYSVKERLYDGDARLIEDRFSVSGAFSSTAQRSFRYQNTKEWSRRGWQARHNLVEIEEHPRQGPVPSYDPDLGPIEIASFATKLAYEEAFNQLAHIARSAARVGATTAVPVEHTDFIFNCPVLADPVCEVGLDVCVREAELDDMLLRIEGEILAILDDVGCLAEPLCVATLTEGVEDVLVRYELAQRELAGAMKPQDLAYLRQSLDVLGGLKTETTIIAQTELAVAPLLDLPTDELLAKLTSSMAKWTTEKACQMSKTCQGLSKQRSLLIGKRAQLSTAQTQKLEKLIPGSDAKLFTKIYSTLNALENIYAFSDVVISSQWVVTALEFELDRYVRKPVIALMSDALYSVDVARMSLVNFRDQLPPVQGPIGDNKENRCRQTRFSQMRVGAEGPRRVTDFLWSAGGNPTSISQQGGLAAAITYSHAGRGHATEVVTELYGESYGALMPAARCGDAHNPWAWVAGENCWLRNEGLSADVLAAINSADNGPAETSSTLTYTTLGLPATIESDGRLSTMLYNTNGILLETVTASGLTQEVVTSYEGWPTWEREVSSTGITLSGARAVYDAEGRPLLLCTELEAGACGPVENQFLAQVDSFGVDHVAGGFGCQNLVDFVLSEAAPLLERNPRFLLQLNKYTSEGRLRCTIDALGRVQEFDYDALARVQQTLSYNSYGRPRYAATVTSFTYNDDGQVTFSLVTGDVQAQDSPQLASAQGYDGFGRPRLGVAHRGLATLVDYGFNGQASRLRTFATALPLDVAVPTEGALGAVLDEEEVLFDPFGQEIGRYLNGAWSRETTYGHWGRSRRTSETGFADSFATANVFGEVLWSSDGAGTENVFVLDRPAGKEISSTLHLGESTYAIKNVTTLLDANLLPVTIIEDGMVEGESFEQRTSTLTRDEAGRVLKLLDNDGIATWWNRNLGGWPLKVKRQLTWGSTATEVTESVYNGAGALAELIDPAGQSTLYTYLGDGNPASVVYPNGETWSSFYDDLGRRSAETKPDGTTLTYVFDGRADLVEVWTGTQASAQRVFEYERDARGRLVRSIATNDHLSTFSRTIAVEERFTYDSLGRVAQESLIVDGGPARSLLTEWSTSGNWIRTLGSQDVPGLELWVERYDAAGRLAQIDRDQNQVAFGYTGSNLSAKTWTLPGVQLNERISHNAFSEFSSEVLDRRFTSSTGPELAQFSLRDRVGRVVSERVQRDVDSKTTSLWRGVQYDGHGRLAKRWAVAAPTSISLTSLGALHDVTPAVVATRTNALGVTLGATRHEWTRNALGSPTARSDDGMPAKAWQRNLGEELNEITVGGTTSSVRYDANRRVLNDGAYAYEYAPFDQLLSVASMTQAGGLGEAYVYTASGRMAAVYDVAGNLSQQFLYDGDERVASLDAVGAVIWQATWGPGLDELVLFSHADFGSSVPIQDERRSVIAAWSIDNKALSNLSTFDADGNRTFFNTDAVAVCSEAAGVPCGTLAGIPFGFTGAWTSEATGLVNMRHRWFSPRLGQFLTQDPLEYIDSFNRYAYAGFDPINFRDAFGLGTGVGQSGGGGDANDNGGNFGGDDQPDSLDWALADFDQGVVQALRDQSMVDFITRNALPQFDRPVRPSSQYVEGYTLATRAVAAAQIGAGLITVAGGTTLAILSPASGPGAAVVIVVSTEAVVFGGALATVGVGNLLNPTALMEKGGGGGSGPRVTGRRFEGNPKHGSKKQGRSGAEPTNPQTTLERSVELPGNTSRRVGVDKKSGEFSVFDEHAPNVFHGHVRTWGELTPTMRATLQRADLATKKGKIR